MTLLIKDHKTWSIVPKTRSVMGGNEGGNSRISEFISLVLEPVAREEDGNMEINGLLADIVDLNAELDVEKRTQGFSIPEEEFSIPQEGLTNHEEELSSHEEDPLNQYMQQPMTRWKETSLTLGGHVTINK